VWRELLNDNLAKLKIVAWCAPLLREYGWLGVGRGAFESVFEAYRPAVGCMCIHPPGELPGAVGLGVGRAVALAAMVSLGWLFRPGALGVRKSIVVAAGWVAVVALLLQNLADLGLEIRRWASRPWWSSGRCGAIRRAGGGRSGPPSIGRSCAWGSGRSRSRWRRRRARWRSSRCGSAGTTWAPGASCSGTSSSAPTTPRRSAGLPRRAAGRDGGAPGGALLLAARRDAAQRWRDQSPMPWLQLTLERAPVNGRAHLLLAQVLDARKKQRPEVRKQALLELRLAVEHEPGLAERAAPLAAALATSLDELLIAVPEGQAGAMVLNMMARNLGEPGDAGCGARSTSRRWPAIRAGGAAHAAAHVAVVEVAQLAQGHGPGPTCPTQDACAARSSGTPPRSRPRSRELARRRDAGAGPRRAGPARRGGGAARHRVRAAREPQRLPPGARREPRPARRRGEARRRAQGVPVGQLPGRRAVRRRVHVRGRAAGARRDHHAAAVAFMRAAQEEPTEARWLRAAKAAEAAKMLAQAIEALSHVSSMRGGADPEIDVQIARLRAAVVEDRCGGGSAGERS